MAARWVASPSLPNFTEAKAPSSEASELPCKVVQLRGEPRGARTHDPRLKSLDPKNPVSCSHSQPVETVSPDAPGQSNRSQPTPAPRNDSATALATHFSAPHGHELDRLLSIRQVAERLGLCTRTVYDLCSDGRLPCVRIVNVVRVRPAELEAFIARAMRP